MLLSVPLLALAAEPIPQLPPFEIAPGVLMPAASVGHPDTNCTHGKGPGCAQRALPLTAMWLRLGGRGIDTAMGYGNQQYVGAAVRAAVAAGTVARSDVFVTTKINPGGRGGSSSAGCTQANALAQVKADVAQLNVGPLDLVLQHFPCSGTAGNQAVWKGLVQAKAQGLTRSIGVSHFTQPMLEGILSLGMGRPAVNQCQLSVGSHDDATIAFCKSKGIT